MNVLDPNRDGKRWQTSLQLLLYTTESKLFVGKSRDFSHHAVYAKINTKWCMIMSPLSPASTSMVPDLHWWNWLFCFQITEFTTVPKSHHTIGCNLPTIIRCRTRNVNIIGKSGNVLQQKKVWVIRTSWLTSLMVSVWRLVPALSPPGVLGESLFTSNSQGANLENIRVLKLNSKLAFNWKR